MRQIATLYEAIDLWKRMSVASRTAFVQWLAADTSVTLYTEQQVAEKIIEALVKRDVEAASMEKSK